MPEVVISLFSNGKYHVYYGGHEEADSELRLIMKNLKKNEEIVHELTRIIIPECDLIWWGDK